MTRPQSPEPSLPGTRRPDPLAHTAHGLLTWQPLPRDGVRLWQNENQILCVFKPLSISSDVASRFPKQSFVFRGLKGKHRFLGPSGRGGAGREETGPRAGLPVNWAARPVFPITWGPEPICGKTGWKICGGRKGQITGDSCSPPGQRPALSQRPVSIRAAESPGGCQEGHPRVRCPPPPARPSGGPGNEAPAEGPTHRLLPGPPTPSGPHNRHTCRLSGACVGSRALVGQPEGLPSPSTSLRPALGARPDSRHISGHRWGCLGH